MHEPPRVLIVEDDVQITQAIRLRLDRAGYDVVAADNAETGLDIAAAALPDVIVMDIQLPDKDGLTALLEIHERPATHGTPVVILSACSNERRHALELGARYFVEKPFNSKLLLAAIQESLGGTSQPNAPDEVVSAMT